MAIPTRDIDELAERAKKEDFFDQSGRLCGLTEAEHRLALSLVENGGDWNKAFDSIPTTKNSNPNSRSTLKARHSSNRLFMAYVSRVLKEGNTTRATLETYKKALEAKKDYQGEVVDVPDHKTRMQAADKILDLLMKSEELEKEAAGRHGVASSDYGELEQWLETQPLEVMEWVYENDRVPNETELKAILGQEKPGIPESV